MNPITDSCQYCLLVLDIDGTLTGFDGSITPAVKDAVQQAMAAGVLVTLATGRSFALARTYAQELELRLPLIVHSGASIRDSATGAVLYETPVSSVATARMVQLAADHGLQPILFRTGGVGENVLTGPAEMDTEATHWYLGNKRDNLVRLPVGQLAESGNPLNIAVPATYDAGLQFLDVAQSVPDCRVFVTQFQRHSWVIVEALAPECSKAAAMRHLSAELGISREQVIAAGDQPNDLEMIESAGLGIAMGNATASVKEKAKVVAPSNLEDGVAWIINRFILGKVVEA